MIRTERLQLIPASVAALEAELHGAAALSAVLGVTVPENWPPDLYDDGARNFILGKLRARPEQQEWWLYYFAESDGAGLRVVGCGGYKGPPVDGVVEVGYSVLEQFRRRGYASEATLALCAHAFTVPDVNAIIAETLPELTASIGVLRRCGFVFIGDGSEPGVIRYELSRAGLQRAERITLNA